MGHVAVYSPPRQKPEPRYHPLVDGWMTLDSGMSWNDDQGIMLRPDMFEHTLLEQTRHHQSDIAASKSEHPGKA